MNTRSLRRLDIVAVLLFAIAASHRIDAQEGSAQEAEQLAVQAAELNGAGRHSEAILLAQRALAIRETVLGLEHPDVGQSLSDLADLYIATGAYPKAEPLLRRELALTEIVFGPEHPNTANSLSVLAELYRATGAYAQARALHQRGLAIREKALGAEHRGTGISLNNLALVYAATGAYTESEQLQQRALAINEKLLGPDDPAVAISLNNLAGLYCYTGAYTKAEPLYQRALEINEKTYGRKHRNTANLLNNLGAFYRETGAYTKAEPLYQRALAILEEVLGPEHIATAGSLNNLAVLYYASSEYIKAEPLFLRAHAIVERVLGPEHPTMAFALNNLAGLYESTGAYAKAEPLYKRALAVQEKVLGLEHPDTAITLNNLANLYRLKGAYTNAGVLHRQALAIREKALGAEHPTTADSLSNLADVYDATGAHGEAEPLFSRALAIKEKRLGPEHPDTGTLLNKLAELYRSTGAYARAEPLHERALAIRRAVFGPEHQSTGDALKSLARLYTSSGAYTQAEVLYERAQEIDERSMLRFLFFGSESRKLQYLRQKNAVSEHVSVSLTHSTARSTALALTSGLRYKGRVLDAMSDSIAQLRRSATAQDRVLLDQLSSVAQDLSTLTFRGQGKLSAQEYRARLDTLTQQQDTLQAQLSSRSATLARALAPTTLDAVRRALPAGAVLMEWFRYRPMDLRAKPASRWLAPRYIVYVLKPTGDPVAIDVGDAELIEALIAEFRSALTNPTTDSRGATRVGSGRANVRELAAQLSERLIKPLSRYVSDSERLLISPDGALNLVPFAALLDERGEYLARNFEISYLTSGRDLLRMADVPARGGAVLLADPNYGSGGSGFAEAAMQSVRSAALDRSGRVFNSLPGTAAEAQSLGSLLELDAQHVLTGDRATEAEVRALHGPRILHLATHGFFLQDEDIAAIVKPSLGFSDDGLAAPLGENPLLRSGLALAGANQRSSGATDDGILTAAEVAQLDLLGTQLVVLSACETALGAVDAGEGVYGLRRALVLAGAQSQLVSLWKVDDAATQALMTDYYHRLLNGAGRAAALRSVQLAMLADPARQHPYYWAAFIPIGNWTPLREFSLVGERASKK